MFINSAKNTNNTSVKTLFVNIKYTLCRIKSNVSNINFFIKNIMSKWFSNFHCAQLKFCMPKLESLVFCPPNHPIF